jgi:hypothetical protein
MFVGRRSEVKMSVQAASTDFHPAWEATTTAMTFCAPHVRPTGACDAQGLAHPAD